MIGGQDGQPRGLRNIERNRFVPQAPPALGASRIGSCDPLPPKHSDAGRDDDRPAHEHACRRRLGEDEEAERRCPDHGDVVERGDDRRVGVAVAVGHEDLAAAAEQADRGQTGEFDPRRGDEALPDTKPATPPPAVQNWAAIMRPRLASAVTNEK